MNTNLKKSLFILIILLVISYISFSQASRYTSYFRDLGISMQFEIKCENCNKSFSKNFCKYCNSTESKIINDNYCLKCNTTADGKYHNECGTKLGYEKSLSDINVDINTLNNKSNIGTLLATIFLVSMILIIIFGFTFTIEMICFSGYYICKKIRKTKKDVLTKMR